MYHSKIGFGRIAAVATAILLPAGHHGWAAEWTSPVAVVAPAEAPLVPVEWMPDGRPIYTHRLVVSGRLIRFEGTMPGAKGPLAFLADHAALRAGKIALTKAEADAALAELVRVTGQEAKATPGVSVAVGNPANMWIARELRYPVGWKKDATGDGGWMASEVETRNEGVGIRVDSQLVTDGRIQLAVTVEITEFEGLVEHPGPTAKSTALPEFLASAGAKPGAEPPLVNLGPHAAPFFEPVFSTHALAATFRMKSGETVVLRGEGKRAILAKGAATSRTETMLVFLTAAVEPIRR